MTDPDLFDEEFSIDEWQEDPEDLEPFRPRWRRPLLIGVAILAAVAMALVPIYNVFGARTVADNGLEVCGFDYCIVQDAVTAAGLDLEMSRLANTFLDEVEARAFATDLTDHLGIDPVGLSVVERLEGRLGGFYDPGTRSIQIESPARAWTVLHEVAHAVENGHGDSFQAVVNDLAGFASNSD